MAASGDFVGFAPTAWVHAKGVLALDRPRVMAVVNATPDSFSDGGHLADARGHLDLQRAVDHCAELIRWGADVLDLGGESTRPGAAEVPVSEELDRVLPLLERLAPLGVPVSIDTRRAAVARAALQAGAAIVNDVSGLADPRMAAVVAEHDAGLVVGHLRGTPQTMQQGIRFVDLLREVTDELAQRVEVAVEHGVERPQIMVDPGIGFGKSAEQSAALVAAAGWLREATRCSVLVGASRKSFLSALLRPDRDRDDRPEKGSRAPATDRLAGSLSAALVAVERGAAVVRVHDVRATVEALGVAASIRAAYERELARTQGGEGGWQ